MGALGRWDEVGRGWGLGRVGRGGCRVGGGAGQRRVVVVATSVPLLSICNKYQNPSQKYLKVVESSRAFLQRSQVLHTFILNVPTLSDVLPSAHPPRKLFFYQSCQIRGPGGPAKKSKISTKISKRCTINI